ncbi:hypothetical protein [Clostridium chromiireducens]|uniref:hypothetical protein n=1 Tax=Clostridium chromiireducens TaxID=225345 RepID=UPI0015FC65BF|nr:hypothetical protein [Clostridium chromiireducens]
MSKLYLLLNESELEMGSILLVLESPIKIHWILNLTQNMTACRIATSLHEKFM